MFVPNFAFTTKSPIRESRSLQNGNQIICGLDKAKDVNETMRFEIESRRRYYRGCPYWRFNSIFFSPHQYNVAKPWKNFVRMSLFSQNDLNVVLLPYLKALHCDINIWIKSCIWLCRMRSTLNYQEILRRKQLETTRKSQRKKIKILNKVFSFSYRDRQNSWRIVEK